jgi:activator of HSP90 ATPase
MDYFFNKVAKEKKKYLKVCTNCGWEGEVSFSTRKCKVCGNMNLKIKK